MRSMLAAIVVLLGACAQPPQAYDVRSFDGLFYGPREEIWADATWYCAGSIEEALTRMAIGT